MGTNFRWIGKTDDGEQVVLRKFPGKFLGMRGKDAAWIESHRARLGKAVAIDVETTGLDQQADAIIEIAAREIYYDPESGKIEWVGEAATGLQDPGRPLPPEITRLTGIRDEDVKGKTIDWDAVDRLIIGANFVFAHNAGFDRPFVEKHSQAARTLPWACSFSQLDWKAEGFPSQKLEVLTIYHGFFCDAHRALGDVDALIHLLEHSSAVSEKPYFFHLLTNHRVPLAHLIAANSPFESKDALKRRGYYWDSRGRYWHKKLAKDKVEAEIRWLETEVYRGRFRGTVEEIPLERNFS